MSAKWYCVNTNARSEDIAVRHLTRRGFTVMFPQFAHPRTKRLHPLFPCYLFVQFDVARSNWQLIYSTPGVHRLFTRSAGVPLEISQQLIECIQEQIDYAQQESATPALPSIMQGDDVMVDDDSSPFNQLQGVCAQNAGSRVEVLLSILGRECAVEFNSKSLVKV